MRNAEFVERVRQIADSNPTYRTGGDGSDGTCDCIGLVMGAVSKKYPMHSTNYFARYEMDGLFPLSDWRELTVGDLVYKWRDGGSTLHERYKQGGRYFTGDMNDYYHVGVVTSIEPLVITHCTESDNINGIARDNSIKCWQLYGQLNGVEYEDDDAPANPIAHDLAVVYAENGKPVKMRPIPSTDRPYIAEVPVGAQVEIVEQADGWAKVVWGSQRGYMMSEFLRVIGMTPPDPEAATSDGYTITLRASAAAELLAALRKAGVVW